MSKPWTPQQQQSAIDLTATKSEDLEKVIIVNIYRWQKGFALGDGHSLIDQWLFLYPHTSFVAPLSSPSHKIQKIAYRIFEIVYERLKRKP